MEINKENLNFKLKIYHFNANGVLWSVWYQPRTQRKGQAKLLTQSTFRVHSRQQWCRLSDDNTMVFWCEMMSKIILTFVGHPNSVHQNQPVKFPVETKHMWVISIYVKLIQISVIFMRPISRLEMTELFLKQQWCCHGTGRMFYEHRIAVISLYLLIYELTFMHI